MNFWRFIGYSLKLNLKMALYNKIAFALMVVITTFKHGLFVLIWKFFFEKYNIINGWNFSDLLFMYGNVFVAVGCVEAFFCGLRELPKNIDNGQLDIFLLQPRNILLNIAISKSDPEAFGEIIVGLVFICLSGHLQPTLQSSFTVLFLLILGIIFMFSLFLYLSCIGFFIRNAKDFIRELSLNSFIMATNPNSAYKAFFKILTYTIIPVSYLSFFPVEYLRTGDIRFFAIALIGTLGFFSLSYALFKYGLTKYSSGNVMSTRS